MDKFIFGAILVIVGLFIDRIFYNYLYLPQINKIFAIKLSFEEIIAFYKLPISWIGPGFIIIGLLILYFSRNR